MTDGSGTDVVWLLAWLALAGVVLTLAGFCVYCLVLFGRYHRRQQVRLTAKDMVTYTGVYACGSGFFLLALFACQNALEGTSITVPPPVRTGIVLLAAVGFVSFTLAVAVGIFLSLLNLRSTKADRA
jgi:hypothetical protein